MQFHQHFKSSFFLQKYFSHLVCATICGLLFFCKRKLVQKLLIKCWWTWLQVSISLTFYNQLFSTKLFCAAYMCLHLWFVTFLMKKIGTKAARKMLVKFACGSSKSLNVKSSSWSSQTTTTKKKKSSTQSWTVKPRHLLGQDSQNFLRQIWKTFVTFSLKISTETNFWNRYF